MRRTRRRASVFVLFWRRELSAVEPAKPDQTPALGARSQSQTEIRWRAAHARHSRRSTSDFPAAVRRRRCDGSSPGGRQALRLKPHAQAEPPNLHERQDNSPDTYVRFAQARRFAAFPSDPARRRNPIRRDRRNDRRRRLLGRRMHARSAWRLKQEPKTVARKRRRRRLPHEVPDAWRATVT